MELIDQRSLDAVAQHLEDRTLAPDGTGALLLIEVDGNDVLEIYRVAQEAVKRARDGDGPTLIECKTYRTRAHAEGMGDFTYRTREDVADWKEKCPIKRFRQVVTEDNLVIEVAVVVAVVDHGLWNKYSTVSTLRTTGR